MIVSPKFETVILNQEDFIGKIILNRPQKKNALNKKMIAELKKAISLCEKEKSVKVLILTGQGGSFCSGADLSYLKEIQKYSYEENLEDSKSLAALYIQLTECIKPVIAQVKGSALAGGCGLATACDFVFAETEAKFGYPEVKIGFVAAMVSIFLIRQIGERKARELLMTGKIISAKEARDVGLINSIFPKEKLQAEVDAFCESLSRNSTNAINITKTLFHSYKNDIFKLAEINARVRQTADFIEGISAFLEKRQPNW